MMCTGKTLPLHLQLGTHSSISESVLRNFQQAVHSKESRPFSGHPVHLCLSLAFAEPHRHYFVSSLNSFFAINTPNASSFIWGIFNDDLLSIAFWFKVWYAYIPTTLLVVAPKNPSCLTWVSRLMCSPVLFCTINLLIQLSGQGFFISLGRLAFGVHNVSWIVPQRRIFVMFHSYLLFFPRWPIHVGASLASTHFPLKHLHLKCVAVSW